MSESFFDAGSDVVNTEVNPQGRAKLGGFRLNVAATQFVAAAKRGIANDVLEIGYGMKDALLKASKANLDRSFEQMNSRW